MKRTLLHIILGCLITLAAAGQEVNLQQLVSSKRFEAAVAQAVNFTAADSANYQTMFTMGQAYDGLLKYRDAYGYFRHCFTMDTTSYDLLTNLARTATNLGRAKEAEQFYFRALAADSTDFYANYQLARLYQQTGDIEESLDRYDRLLEQYPGHTAILRNMGDIHYGIKNYFNASAFYSQAFEGNRENASLAHTLINTLFIASSVDMMGAAEYLAEALVACDTALYYNPGNQQIRQDKALGYYMGRKYAAADSIYTELLAEGDSTYTNLKYGGCARYYARNYYDAIDLLELAYKADTTVVDINILLGAALGRTYDRKRAYVLFDQAEEMMQPGEFLVNLLDNSRAETLVRDRRIREAIQIYYKMWLKIGQANLLHRMTLMTFKSKLSDYADATERQRALFLVALYCKTQLSEGNSDGLYSFHSILSQLQEDMFFRSVTEEPLLSPDGKRSTLKADTLREWLSKIPSERPKPPAPKPDADKSDGKTE